MAISTRPTVGADTNIWGSKLNTYLGDRFDSVFNVKSDYGAVGDGSTDDTLAIQAAINAVDVSGNDRGGVIFFPRGLYKVSGLTYSGAAPIKFLGEVATMGNITGTTGANLVPSANGQTLLTIGSGTTIYEGCHLENLNFYGNTFTGCTGLKLDSVSHWTAVRIGCKDLSIGIEVRASAASDNAWNVLLAPSIYNCAVAGLKIYDSFGMVVVGGDFNITDPAAGTAYGIYLTGGAAEATQSVKCFGTFFDSHSHPSAGQAIGVYVERGHECLFEGCKFEQLDIGVEITNADGSDSTSGAMNVISNCTFVAAAGDIGIQVDANASDTFIINPSMHDVGTGITNNGARTRVIGGRLDVTTPFAGAVSPETIAVNMPDGGSGRFSQTRFGTGSAADKWSMNGVAPVTKRSGWTAATGTPTRTTFATGSVTLPVLAEHVKALIDDLLALGVITA